MRFFDKWGDFGTLAMAVFILLSASANAQVTNNPDGSQTLPHHVPKVVAQGLATKIAHADPNQMLDLRILLPSRDQAGLDKFINELYDPKSLNYHRFLTPEQFALQYGASSIDSSIVLQHLKSHGLIVKKQSKNGFVITVQGPVSTVEPLFKVNINSYKGLDGKTFYSNDVNPTIPAELSGKIYAIAGMDNAIRFYPHMHRGNLIDLSNAKGPLKAVNLNTTKTLSLTLSDTTGMISSKTNIKPQANQTFRGYGGSFGPADIADVYNLTSLNSGNITGSGQNMALYELDGYVASNITAFESYYGLPNMTLTNIIDTADGADGSAGINTDEVVIDIDLSIAVAPGLNSVRVYEAPNTGTGWIDQWDTIAADSLAKVISCSWGADEADTYPYYDHSVFSQLASQGQTVFASAGDSGAYDNCDSGTLPPSCTVNGAPATGVLSVDDPASDQYITGVGISVVTVNNAGQVTESYNSETSSLYGGGGISSYVSIPSFQSPVAALAPGAAMVSTTWRNVPDVVFTADQATQYGFYVSDISPVGWYGFWGSSLSSPIWAAFITRVNQGRVAESETVIGFLNPAIYQIAQSSDYSTDFHDISTGDNSYYPAETGFDDASGLGSFNGAHLYNDLVATPPSITLQPMSQTVVAPATATFTVTATGTPTPTYQWEQNTGSGWTVIGGATGTTYTTPATTGANNGTQFECVVNNLAGNVTSTVVTMTVDSIPDITTQPSSQTVTAPATATFTVVANGAPAPTYQWQENSGSGWTPIGGATSASYTTGPTSLAENGTQFECLITNFYGTVTTNPATLTVYTLPNITLQPISQTVVAPATATFTIAATGSPTPTYQWEQNTGSGWTVIGGATGTSYTTPATTGANNGTQFECVVNNLAGNVTSTVVTMTVDSIPDITTQPSSQIVTAPATATFTVVANGAPTPTYQWQENSGSGWTPIGGATSASYTTGPTSLAESGTQFECLITNFYGTVTTNPATLTVYIFPSITLQPVSQTVTAPATATFTIAAMGTPSPTYQWQQSINGGSTWTPIGGATGTSYTTLATTGSNNATQFECVVNNAAGTVTSSAAILTVDYPPGITTQPSDQTVDVPATATFTVVAIGNPSPTYQWQQSTDGGSTWTPIGGATSATYITPATTLAESGTQFECVITNGFGVVTSSAVTLTVLNPVASPSALSLTKLGARIGGQIIYGGVVLAWTQSPTPSVIQNKIYRSEGSGPFTLLAIVGATTSYKDTKLEKGNTYNYQVTALNSDAIESLPSNSAAVNY